MKEKQIYSLQEAEVYLEDNSFLIRDNEIGEDKTYWRYQMVYTEKDGVKEYGIIEVYCDSEDKLEMWTTEKIRPIGSDFAGLNGAKELIKDLELMLVDAKSWAPVSFDILAVGMTFNQISIQNSLTLPPNTSLHYP